MKQLKSSFICGLLLHNKPIKWISSQCIIFENKFGGNVKKKNNNTFINLTGLYTHPTSLEVIRKTHHVLIHTSQISRQVLPYKMNHDFYPRGPHSFIKTCHSLTFTPCCKLTAWPHKREMCSSWPLLLRDVLACGWLLFGLWKTKSLERNNIKLSC